LQMLPSRHVSAAARRLSPRAPTQAAVLEVATASPTLTHWPTKGSSPSRQKRFVTRSHLHASFISVKKKMRRTRVLVPAPALEEVTGGLHRSHLLELMNQQERQEREEK